MAAFKLYTFILEYAGGTYISQERAQSVESATAAWARGVSFESIGAHLSQRIAFLQNITDETYVPVPVSGNPGVWCTCIGIGENMALVNIVKTAE
jgi:hypothetical protein